MVKVKASTLMIFSLSILFTVFFYLCKHDAVLSVVNPFASDPYDAVGSFGIQLALFSALVMLIRAFRPYPEKVPASERLLLIASGGTVVLLSVAVTLAADFIGLVRAMITHRPSPAAWMLAGLLSSMALVTMILSWVFIRDLRMIKLPLARSRWARVGIIFGLDFLILAFYPLTVRDSSIPGAIFTVIAGMVLFLFSVWGFAAAMLPTTEYNSDIFDDLSALFQGLKQRFGFLTGPLNWLEMAAGLPLLGGHPGMLNPRKHRWNLVILTGLLMGLMLVMTETIAEGMSPHLGKFLLVVGVYIFLEASGVLLGFLLFGKTLGLFRMD
jgi:hypothetical protein